jgi:hypothetical protein
MCELLEQETIETHNKLKRKIKEEEAEAKPHRPPAENEK